MKKLNKKGFTLAELLIVVAIIAVLVAVSIPVFNSQLEKARDATTAANLRAAYAEAMVSMLDNNTKTATVDNVQFESREAGLGSGVDLPFEPDGTVEAKYTTPGKYKITFTIGADDKVTAAIAG